MSLKFLKILFPLLIFLFVGLACRINAGGPKPPEEIETPVVTFPQSPEQSLETAIQIDPGSGAMTITLTETQITTYLAAYLASQSEPLLTNPQVVLQNGQVEIFGQVSRGIFSANVHLVLELLADENGSLKPRLTSADLGPVPAPAGALDSLSRSIDEAFTTSVGQHLADIKIETITIADGVIIATGQKR
jgi:uncharacterized protein YpmS